MLLHLHPKFGVNPSLGLCFFCSKAKEVILAGAFGGNEAPREAVWNKDPCDECQKLMAAGVMLISVRNGESGKNPYRTGHMSVVKDEAIHRLLPPELVEDVIRKRVAFVVDEAWDALGLPIS